LPPPLSVTVPADELKVTGSPSGSLKEPVIVPSWSCSIFVVVPATSISGRSLPDGESTTTSSLSIPFVAWKKMWQWKTQRPSAPPEVVSSGIGRGSSRTRKFSV
jgi:hypothetical protein